MQKLQASRLCRTIPKPTIADLAGDRGFGLIEVVVAMVLIAGTYISVVEAYQRVLLHYGQIEVRRSELSRTQDKHERGAP